MRPKAYIRSQGKVAGGFNKSFNGTGARKHRVPAMLLLALVVAEEVVDEVCLGYGMIYCVYGGCYEKLEFWNNWCRVNC